MDIIPVEIIINDLVTIEIQADTEETVIVEAVTIVEEAEVIEDDKLSLGSPMSLLGIP